MISARIETSSMHTGSSATSTPGRSAERAGNDHSLALPSRELVWQPLQVILGRLQPRLGEGFAGPACALFRPRTPPWTVSGSATISPMDSVGLSDSYGS